MRIRISAALFALTIAALPTEAEAAPTPSGKFSGKGGRFGLGLSLGDPLGASMKLFLHPNHALQWDLGWMPLHHGSGGLTMSYQWAPGVFVSNSVMDFFGYLGLGIGMSVWARGHSHGHGGGHGHGHGGDHHHDAWGAFILRVPVLGLAFHWKKAPFDTVMEGGWSPMLPEFTSGHTRVGLAHGDVSFKGRYYF